jgi:cytochrome P450
VDDFISYLRRVLAEHRSGASRGVIGGLVDSGALTDEEIVVAASQMSGTATANTIALAALALLSHEGCWTELTSRSGSLEAVIEELLRYVSAFQVVHRIANEDVEIDGVIVEKGDHVILSLLSANHDPERFSKPDELNLARDAAGHVAFGYGRHICVGQQLARVEIQIALSGLARRFPNLRLAVPLYEIETYSSEHEISGLTTLSVKW